MSEKSGTTVNISLPIGLGHSSNHYGDDVCIFGDGNYDDGDNTLGDGDNTLGDGDGVGIATK